MWRGKWKLDSATKHRIRPTTYDLYCTFFLHLTKCVFVPNNKNCIVYSCAHWNQHILIWIRTFLSMQMEQKVTIQSPIYLWNIVRVHFLLAKLCEQLPFPENWINIGTFAFFFTLFDDLFYFFTLYVADGVLLAAYIECNFHTNFNWAEDSGDDSFLH